MLEPTYLLLPKDEQLVVPVDYFHETALSPEVDSKKVEALDVRYTGIA